VTAATDAVGGALLALAAELEGRLARCEPGTTGPAAYSDAAKLVLRAAERLPGAPDAPGPVSEGSQAVTEALRPAREPSADIPDWLRDERVRLLSETVRRLFHAQAVGDIARITDGITDVVCVAVGTAADYGIPLGALLAAVQAKMAKGPRCEPPDIAGAPGMERRAAQ
jgi:hypothetical protein